MLPFKQMGPPCFYRRLEMRLLICICIFSVCAWAQAPNVEPPANGTQLEVRLRDRVGSKKAKVGDILHFGLLSDVLNENHSVKIPKDATLIGHVTAVKAWNRAQQQASISFVIDSAKWEGGSSVLRAFPAFFQPQPVKHSSTSTTSRLATSADPGTITVTTRTSRGGMVLNGGSTSPGATTSTTTTSTYHTLDLNDVHLQLSNDKSVVSILVCGKDNFEMTPENALFIVKQWR
jgi:hypothetical protein